MSQLLQNQATLSLLAQQQQQLLSGHPSQNTAQTSQANLLLAAQLAQLQSLIPWAPAMAQTAPPGDLYAQLGATAQLLNPFMGFPVSYLQGLWSMGYLKYIISSYFRIFAG